MRPEKSQETTPSSDLEDTDIPHEWIPLLIQAGYTNREALRKANPSTLFNQLGGLRKKNKINIPMPSLDQVKQWIASC
jgi:lysyl-tRNA synthetase class 2